MHIESCMSMRVRYVHARPIRACKDLHAHSSLLCNASPIFACESSMRMRDFIIRIGQPHVQRQTGCLLGHCLPHVGGLALLHRHRLVADVIRALAEPKAPSHNMCQTFLIDP